MQTAENLVPAPEGPKDAAEAGLKVGHIVSVTGSKIMGSLVSVGPDADTAARLNEAVQIGALVKMPTARSVAFGIVSSLTTGNPSPSPSFGEQWVVEIDLFGEYILQDAKGADGFDLLRGVSIYPGLGDPIMAATPEELRQIYKRPKASNVCIGTLHQDREMPAYLVTDDLLGKHFAILGTTGSGKSCALATVLHAILAEHPFGHVVLLDPHNEYSSAFQGLTEVVTPENLQLPYWLLNFEEMVEVMCSRDEINRSAESFILKDAILMAKRATAASEDEGRHLTVDTPAPYPLSALLQNIEAAMGQLQKAEQAKPYLRLRSRIENLRADRRYAFMFSGLSVKDTLPDVLARIIRVPVDGKPLTTFDLSGVPSEIVDVVVSLLCRTLFDFAVWSERDAAVPVLLVCEEAHRYIPEDDDKGFEPTRRMISRIAKEGRKYGLSLGLVSQRPSELSETIVSQCSTLFALRMGNQKDQDFVRRALPESAEGMLASLRPCAINRRWWWVRAPSCRCASASTICPKASVRRAIPPASRRPGSPSAAWTASSPTPLSAGVNRSARATPPKRRGPKPPPPSGKQVFGQLSRSGFAPRLTGSGHFAAGFRKLANQPVRFGRVVEPGLRPALLDAAADGAAVVTLPIVIEQRQFAAGLVEAAT
ncbi:ATP-binding protein [Pelagibius sp.]|uniref:ATP-binding protein n=1 Tax=Pelagibius sp. TaxID=1931238 RepID=UPI003B513838